MTKYIATNHPQQAKNPGEALPIQWIESFREPAANTTVVSKIPAITARLIAPSAKNCSTLMVSMVAIAGM
ncbi:hypothetical protein [Stieleria neptunia]|uniref:hypothetical protein n=1 Tax=Stieleria neptunia TaxID=2527979 RepID=UPI001E6127F2|nr:hypothetical protein [Stieleria neptunia]